MSLNPFPKIRRGLGFLWRVIDATRRTVLNLLFLALAGALVYGLFGGGGGEAIKPLAARTTLVLDLQGQLVEQHSGSVGEALVSNLGSESKKAVRLRDLLLVLAAAERDPNIVGALVVLDDLQGGGLAMRREVSAALDRFRAAGKPVTAWGRRYDQRQYLVAAHADHVFLHPMGMVLLEGFGRYRNYYRDALDKLGVTVNLLKAGTYKSFAEPFIANGPSAPAAEAEAYLNHGLWRMYTDDVEKARKLPQGRIMQTIDELPKLAASVDGDLARLALYADLVDGLKTRDEVRQMLMAQGAPDAEGNSFRQVSFEAYLARQHPKSTGQAIGVVVAQGEISEGADVRGGVGGEAAAKLIRKAREDDQIKALVLRVDSPGGSALGSELIRRELELTRAQGKPVVVSMGDVAASGGYWMAMAADEVIADPGTITGSIGVFAILPTADRVIDKLGIHTAGVTTTWLGDAANPLRPLDPRLAKVIQSSIDHVYADFTAKAAKARKTTPDKIHEVAQGRVWSGAQAKERGLVDTLGSYKDALASAASRAGLKGDYRIAYIERDSSRFDRLVELFGSTAANALGLPQQLRLGLASSGIPPDAAFGIAGELSWLSSLREGKQPFLALTHCMCGSP
jgi:protease-4